MRFSAVATLCAAPLALASILDAELIPRGGLSRRGGHVVQEPAHAGSAKQVVKDVKGANVHGTATTIVIIWVNKGAGAATSTVNPTHVAPQATHTVTVGGAAGLVYTPEQLAPAVGDIVVFEFWAANHTVTQSPFDTPCKKLEGGLDSGFMANPNNTIVPPPQMAMQVTTDKPLWFYCRQRAHCGKGMVFSINPTADKTQAKFKELAIAQNGTGAVPPIAGGPPGSSAAPPAASSTVAAPPAGTGAPQGGMATGIGQIENGQCTCSCLCGVASFPNPSIQGRGAYGGFAGAMPLAALER